MTDAELLKELADRKALIVHCSRTGKGDEGIDGLLFPEDLRNAVDICANQSKELCCSVVWPEHVETFGAVGIILKPRSVKSITSISTTDGGTSLDPKTGKRVGLGLPFTSQGVADTFSKATDYNEWNVQDADTVGIFVHPREPLDVAKMVSLSQVPGYYPQIGEGQIAGTVRLTVPDVVALFSLPVYSFQGKDIVRFDGSGFVPINASDLYR